MEDKSHGLNPGPAAESGALGFESGGRPLLAVQPWTSELSPLSSPFFTCVSCDRLFFLRSLRTRVGLGGLFYLV